MIRNFLMVAALGAALMIGCNDTTGNGDGKDKSGGESSASAPAGNMTQVAWYCGSCGHTADAGHACDVNCEACECGVHKGSDLCCKVPEELKGKDICSCGYAKGSADCCKEAAERCDKCQMIKGSDMCCKLESTAGQDAANQ
jgi:hypothetical protein